jgi:hypothetical protein
VLCPHASGPGAPRITARVDGLPKEPSTYFAIFAPVSRQFFSPAGGFKRYPADSRCPPAAASAQATSIWRVLKAHGLVTPQPHKRPRSSYVRLCAELPNECWQTDITCWREVEIIGVIDDHSRLCVIARAFAQGQSGRRRCHLL